jgi:hypothetical protein
MQSKGILGLVAGLVAGSARGVVVSFESYPTKNPAAKVLFFAVLLLLISSGYAWPQSVPSSQSGSHAALQTTVEPRFDQVAPHLFLSAEPPELKAQQLQRLEKALERTHRISA